MHVAPKRWSVRRAGRSWIAVAVLGSLALPGCTTYEAARLYQSGTAELERGEVERAIADLERAAVLAPEASEIQNHLGLALAAAGRDQAARGAFRRAVDLDCSNEAAQQNLAWIETRVESKTDHANSEPTGSPTSGRR